MNLQYFVFDGGHLKERYQNQPYKIFNPRVPLSKCFNSCYRGMMFWTFALKR